MSGLDNIPNKALKAAVKIAPNMFAEAFTTCLKEGVFPAWWRKQKLILASKRKKSLGETSFYRPIYLIGKLFERIIYNNWNRQKWRRSLWESVRFSKGEVCDRCLVANTAKAALDEDKLLCGDHTQCEERLKFGEMGQNTWVPNQLRRAEVPGVYCCRLPSQ